MLFLEFNLNIIELKNEQPDLDELNGVFRYPVCAHGCQNTYSTRWWYWSLCIYNIKRGQGRLSDLLLPWLHPCLLILVAVLAALM